MTLKSLMSLRSLKYLLLSDEEEHREHGECVAQLFESERQMIFDCLFGDVERVGDGLVVETEIAAHLEYAPALLGHPADDETDEKLLFAGVVFVLERFVADLFLDLRNLGEIDIYRPADMVERRIARHFIYVAAERLHFPPPENFASFPNLGEYVLRDVFRRIALFDNAVHESAHFGIVQLEQFAKGFFIAFREPLHQSVFIFVRHIVDLGHFVI